MSHQPQYVEPEFVTQPIQPIAAGKTGRPEVLVTGGSKASGKIVFTGNLVAGDTVTINGVVFTCVASGATGAQFDVDSTLALSLASLNTVLNASVNPLVSIATYTVTDTDTAITASFDDYGTSQNSVVLASTHSTVVVTQPSGGRAMVSLSLDTEHSQINLATSITVDFYLPDGDESQRKTIAMLGSGTANIKSAGSKLPGSTVNYAMNGADALILQWLSGKWRLILNDGATAT